ncbi:MAG TPA: hypothetical protein VJU15_06185 [Gemmatimonadales bacterium]|nr:hypothetical protein [Gemmatimonadales bacterium]
MKLARRLLGLLWTLVAAVPVAVRHGDAAEAARPGASAEGGGSRSETRASPGAPKVGLAEPGVRDLRTPFLPAPQLTVAFPSRVIRLDAVAVRRSDGQTVRRSNNARAPPALH